MTHGASHEFRVYCEHDCWQAPLYHIHMLSSAHGPSAEYLSEHLFRQPKPTLKSQYDGQGVMPLQDARHENPSQMQVESCMHVFLLAYLPWQVVSHVPFLSVQKDPLQVVVFRTLHFWMQLPSDANWHDGFVVQ